MEAMKVVATAGTETALPLGSLIKDDQYGQFISLVNNSRLKFFDDPQNQLGGMPINIANAGSAILCCISAGGSIAGVIALLFKQQQPLNAEDEIFFDAVSNILAVAIDRKLFEDNLALVAEELKRSNADLQQFASAAAHDLQEPLRSVVSYLDLLESRLLASGEFDEKSKRYMSTSSNAARRMQILINDLLEYSRISTRNKMVSNVDTQELVKHVVENLSTAIEESQAKVTTSPDLPKVKADPSQFAQLLQNLISNAIKFRSPDRAPEITISAKHQDNEWIFCVADNGIGFEMEYAQRIFIVFQRLHSRGKYPGTGIGLAICKRIVERHNGRIWVESQPAQGTAFYFSWPEEVHK
jgi:light-regulated signal transduction histidine kinase (bacteriophytochrome)